MRALERPKAPSGGLFKVMQIIIPQQGQINEKAV
jgi:hypothetical protein